jgi:hypothetical protein
MLALDTSFIALLGLLLPQCVEDVDVYDAKTNTIITSNDNNFPYSSSRRAGKADDNELLILEVCSGAC